MTFAASVFSAAVEALRGVDDIVRERHFGGDARALFDAAAAEVAPVGREVLADRDVERAAVGQRLLLLEDALAEGVGADDRRAVVILQRRGDDLRGRGGVVIDEHHHRDRRRDRIAGRGDRLARLGAPARRDDRAVRDEEARDQPRLLDEAAAVGAQVEHDPARAFVQLAFRPPSATSPCAPGLNVASATTPSFTPCTVRVAEATTGSEIVARVTRTVCVVPVGGPCRVPPAGWAAVGWRGSTAGPSIPARRRCPAAP